MKRSAKSLILLACFGLSFVQTTAQVDEVSTPSPSILNADTLVEGIYKTFEEFRRNKPFHTSDFKILPYGRVDNVLINNWNDEIVYKNGNGKTKQQGAQRFFGYYKGDTIYVKTIFRHHGFKSVSFCPVMDFGHLSIVRFYKHIGTPVNDSLTMIDAVNIFGVSGAAGPKIVLDDQPIEKLYVLDFMTGDFLRLRYYVLTDKFKVWDKPLYQELRKANSKKDSRVLIDFIRKFNERNPIRF